MTMREKQIIIAARVMSMVLTPFYLPLVGLGALFIFSYMSLAPWQYKLTVLLMVYIFAILLPTLLIHAYRNYQGWTRMQLSTKERRLVPYVITIISYFGCYYLMVFRHIPQFMANILMAALVIQIICAVINVWWKVSTHTAAIGGFAFNPMWWFCVILIIAGMVGTSRMLLRQHSLSQVVVGFLIGMVAGFWAII